MKGLTRYEVRGTKALAKYKVCTILLRELTSFASSAGSHSSESLIGASRECG
jgi:hypothetical protein